MPYFGRSFKDVLRQCDQHGVDHRLPMNQTPLMAAAAAGNVALVEALLERGADPEATDHYGWNALHWALRESFRDPAYARGSLAAVFERVAPTRIDVNTGDVKLAFAAATPIQATPTTLVLDREGRIAARIIGRIESPSILSTLIGDALAEP